MGKASRVGQRGELMVFVNGQRTCGGVVEILDDKSAAVWMVRNLETGAVFKVMAGTIRFYG